MVRFSNRQRSGSTGRGRRAAPDAPSHTGWVPTVVVVLAVFMTNLDLWIVNVALPAMGEGFTHGGPPVSLANLSWVLNAYAIALAALLVAAGRLADRVGQRQVFLAGIVIFTVASTACAVAPSLPFLVAARAVQAIGAAAQLPTSLALLMASVPASSRPAAARGWAAVGGLAAASGPVLGGLLVEVDWRWVFIVNVPIGAVALIAGLRTLPRAAARESGPIPDVIGAVLVTLSVAALAGALVQAPDWGWRSARTAGLFAVAVASGAWFAWRCLHHHSPLMELHLLRERRFAVANAGVLVFSVSFAIMLLSNVLWCQDVWHWSALRTGLAMVPGPALVPLVTMASARAMRRLGPGPLIVAGGVLFAASMLWRVVFVSVRPDYLGDLFPSMVLGGAAVGLAMGTLIAAGVTSLPAHRSATGSALVNSNRQIASAVGVAILVTLLGTRLGAAAAGDFRLGWGIAAALALLTAGAGAGLMSRGRVGAAGGAPGAAGGVAAGGTERRPESEPTSVAGG